MESGTHEGDTALSKDVDATTTDPAVTFKSITFSDGTTIELEPTDVVVLVGPNNVGKSVALRDLENQLVGVPSKRTVVTAVRLRRDGSIDELRKYLEKHAPAKERGRNQQESFEGLGFSIPVANLEHHWSKARGLGALANLFCRRLQTESRINDSDPAHQIRTREERASHPIQLLYLSGDLEKRISGYFSQAFGKDLFIDRLGGSEWPLLVGEHLAPQCGEDRLSDSYLYRLYDSAVPLAHQGDGMRSFASVILHLLAPTTPSVLILDEPEAFLHPPQARLLGELIAKERSSRAQLFVATHSPDVLNGLLNVAPDHLKVLRIRREGEINHIKELDKERAKEISNDPLMKYSSVMSGVFHERVIICESDADCMFYSSLLDLPEIHGDRQPDALFVHANGKHRMIKLAEALTDLDVPVDVIADIDILQSDDVLKKIIETLGGNWDEIESMARTVRCAIESRKPGLNAGDIKKAIQEALEDIQPVGEFPREKKSEIELIFRQSSPWAAVKEAGEAAIPQGQATQKFQELADYCSKVGLWIVPVGELEGFCKSVGGHGPKWVQQVIEDRDLPTDPDLQSAREFVRTIWGSRSLG